MGNYFIKNSRKNSKQTEKPQMDEVLLRFGHIGDQIFDELNSQTLSKCQMVGRSWNLFLDQGKVRPFRMIKTYIKIDKKYLRNRIKKINSEKANELANIVRNIYQNFPKRTGNVNPRKSESGIYLSTYTSSSCCSKWSFIAM